MGQMYLFECFVCILVELNAVTDPRRAEGYYCPSVLWLKKWQAKAVLQISCMVPSFRKFIDPLLKWPLMINLDTATTVLTDPVVEVSHVGVNGR